MHFHWSMGTLTSPDSHRTFFSDWLIDWFMIFYPKVHSSSALCSHESRPSISQEWFLTESKMLLLYHSWQLVAFVMMFSHDHLLLFSCSWRWLLPRRETRQTTSLAFGSALWSWASGRSPRWLRRQEVHFTMVTFTSEGRHQTYFTVGKYALHVGVQIKIGHAWYPNNTLICFDLTAL